MIKRMKWNYELAEKVASKYETRNEFKKNSENAYNYARRANILDKITIHMRKRFIWTFKLVFIEANKYTTRKEFSNKSSGAYGWAQKNRVLDEICVNMNKVIKWEYKLAKKEARKYKTRGEFQKKAQGAYRWAMKNNKLDKITKHMPDVIRWNLMNAKKEAKKHSSRQDLFYNASGLYSWAFDNNCLDEVCRDMPKALSRGFDSNKAGKVYYIRIDKDGDTVYKIGITNNNIERRFGTKEMEYITPIYSWEFENGADARKLEKEILNDYSYAKYKGPDILDNGNTEMFIDDVLMLDKMC